MQRGSPARKRPVNLTLDADLVDQAKNLTGNLSAVVESLLSDYVMEQRQQASNHQRAVAETVALWNRFDTCGDSFADEYSTL